MTPSCNNQLFILTFCFPFRMQTAKLLNNWRSAFLFAKDVCVLIFCLLLSIVVSNVRYATMCYSKILKTPICKIINISDVKIEKYMAIPFWLCTLSISRLNSAWSWPHTKCSFDFFHFIVCSCRLFPLQPYVLPLSSQDTFLWCRFFICLAIPICHILYVGVHVIGHRHAFLTCILHADPYFTQYMSFPARIT